MIASRRLEHNFSLQRAVEHAKSLNRPLLIFEPLSISFPWSSVRFVSFVLDGMREKQVALERLGVSYLPWVETRRKSARGLLATLAREACCVVSDDSCTFQTPTLIDQAAKQLPCLLEAVEADTLTPTSTQDRMFTRAASFRRWLHKRGPDGFLNQPAQSPLQDYRLGRASYSRLALQAWDLGASDAVLSGHRSVGQLDIDSWVGTCSGFVGGEEAGKEFLNDFVQDSLPAYSRGKNHPDSDQGSRLAPYLHWGFLSPHRILFDVLQKEQWTCDHINHDRVGSREGWWGLSPSAEGFLDQLITWRELGWNGARKDSAFGTWEGIPTWARETLTQHQGDRREAIYSYGELEAAQTGDPIWNAAQRQLKRTGRIHSYLRMLWGKRVLGWMKEPEEAFHTLLFLNNKYALDGRDPNSITGISWIFGRYDRAWGPERPVFGKVRYMSSANTKRKLRLGEYLTEYAAEEHSLAS